MGRKAEEAKNKSTRIRRLVSVPPGRVSAIGLPVVRSAVRIWLTVAVGQSVRIVAKAPATCGAAIEVPIKQS
jgi:hypothetical protein